MSAAGEIGRTESAVPVSESSCPASGLAAKRVLRAWNIEDLRGMAKRRLPRAVFDFFDGAAEDETTLRENRAAFERVIFPSPTSCAHTSRRSSASIRASTRS